MFAPTSTNRSPARSRSIAKSRVVALGEAGSGDHRGDAAPSTAASAATPRRTGSARGGARCGATAAKPRPGRAAPTAEVPSRRRFEHQRGVMQGSRQRTLRHRVLRRAARARVRLALAAGRRARSPPPVSPLPASLGILSRGRAALAGAKRPDVGRGACRLPPCASHRDRGPAVPGAVPRRGHRTRPRSGRIVITRGRG